MFAEDDGKEVSRGEGVGGAPEEVLGLLVQVEVVLHAALVAHEVIHVFVVDEGVCGDGMGVLHRPAGVSHVTEGQVFQIGLRRTGFGPQHKFRIALVEFLQETLLVFDLVGTGDGRVAVVARPAQIGRPADVLVIELRVVQPEIGEFADFVDDGLPRPVVTHAEVVSEALCVEVAADK